MVVRDSFDSNGASGSVRFANTGSAEAYQAAGGKPGLDYTPLNQFSRSETTDAEDTEPAAERDRSLEMDGVRTGSSVRVLASSGPSRTLWRRVCKESNAEIAAGKAISVLMKEEHIGKVSVERLSVYGSAVAIPQIARSVSWPATFTGLSIRAYVFLLLNIIIQAFLISMIGNEMLIVNPFAGKMHLCDFGKSIADCPNAQNCRGPGGTTISFPRLYSFDIWSTRLFVKSALVSLFPDREDDIDTAADPGEYALESYGCRCACVFIFMMAVADELSKTYNVAHLIFCLPTESQPWLKYIGSEFPDKAAFKRSNDLKEIHLVKFQVAGMPLHWKIINFVLVFIPKVVLWLGLVFSGVRFLMETSDILGVILNAMALTYIFAIDEIIFNRLSTEATKYIMDVIEPYQLFDTSEEDGEQDIDALRRFRNEELNYRNLRRLWIVVPKRLLMILLLQLIFIVKYYYINCDLAEDGSLVSKDIYWPARVEYQPLRYMFGLKPDLEEEPVWSMPKR